MSIYLRGCTYWCDIRTASGQRIKKSLRTTEKRAAQELHDKLKHELWKQERLGETPSHTWDESALRWLDEKEGKRTISSDARIIELYTEYFSGRYISSLSADEIKRVTAKITHGMVYQNRCLALIRSILIRAEKHWMWIEKAPAITLNQEPKKRIRYLTKTEAHRLLDELPDHLRDMVEFSLNTGLRQSNVTGLKWSAIDLGRRMIIINAEDFKNGNDHGVPLNDTAVEIIRRQIGKHLTHVFTYKGQPVTQCNTRAFRNALKRAGITGFKWHDLRHTWASWMRQAGVSLDVLQELGGWESQEMVMRYAHLSTDHLRDYVMKIEGTKSPTGGLEEKIG